MTLYNSEDLKNKHIREQTQYDLDELIEELKVKWESDKYYYDEEEARKFYTFITKLELDKGVKGQKIQPLRFQFIHTSEILCVKDKENNRRRYREALLDISRKNGKGSLVSWIAVYLYFTDPTFGAEYIIVANDIKQATNLFKTMQLMINNNSTLRKHVKITESKREMFRKSTNSTLRVLANDGANLDSYASYLVILDEIHEYKNNEAYTKLRTGMGLWDDPLLFMTTTASSGEDPHNLEMQMYNYAKDVENGEVEDESFYSAIYEADKECDLMDEEQWYKSNPALSIFRKLKDLKDFMLKASRIKTLEPQARRLYLNQHVALDGEGAIDIKRWEACLQDISLDDLRGMTAYCGLDMAYIQDIIAFVMTFYDEARDKYIVYPLLFTPTETLLERSERDNVRYDMWVRNKQLIGLNGYYVDNEELFNNIDHIINTYQINIAEIAFDRWGSGDVRSRLEKKYTIAPFGQGYKSMSPVIRDLEILLLDGRLIIANNEVLTWMAKNVVATEDAAGNIKYDKSKAKNKIDGIVALLMGLSRTIFNNGEVIFDTEKSTEEYLKKMGW
ncbi:terminase large subunit [Tissierella creatinophila]|uniref:Phage terminase n=1 Tax=Tissierella creatinophila DSM 6911 TaxID=1123403 RepID=A0A1U7M6L0_TISCR|nr:terminase TerL endonuclease subunit [Tissierella creatinophila]OLS02890.1 phage terminase [Tissierella creatinophila DSM 6911]